MMHHAPAFMATPEFFWDWVVINWALLSTVLYVAFYLALEFKNRESLSGLGILAVGPSHFLPLFCVLDPTMIPAACDITGRRLSSLKSSED